MRRIVLLALVLSGCAGIGKSVSQGEEILSEALLPTDQEVTLGNQLAGETEAKEHPLASPAVQTYVNSVGQRIVQSTHNERPGIKYTFKVIDSPTVNAFALPGGHIYVYSGLLKMVSSEAELAAVLGHEVGHVTSRHAAQSLVQQLGLETVSGMVFGKNPGMVAQLATQIAGQGYMMKNSRDHEREADEKGLAYFTRAGYDPSAMPTMFDKLGKLGGTNPGPVEAFLASHPDPLERARTARARIAAGNMHPAAQTIVGDIRPIQAQLGGAPAPAAVPAAGHPAAAGSAPPPPRAAPPPPRR